MRKLSFILFIVVTVSPASQSLGYSSIQSQAPSALGRWEVTFSLEDGVLHKVRFDAEASGKGTFLLLDVRSNLLPPATPEDASWSQSESNQVSASGLIEFPIGNVGRDPGRLILVGSFTSSDDLSGSAVFISDLKDRPDRKGTFTATRVTSTPAVSVHLMSLNSGGKVRRGQGVNIEWEITGVDQITSIKLFLSVDKGVTFYLIASDLGTNSRSFLWNVPNDMTKAKKALLKVAVSTEKGGSAEDTSDSTFKIK